MTLTRRELFLSAAAAPMALASSTGAWTPEWDRALVAAAVKNLDTAFDPATHMLQRRIGPEYHYHTNLRATTAHPTRDSLEYALLLLEAGGAERAGRAQQVIARTVALQETDPQSKWYGIWGYYLEEPAPKMSPADWNWADFNGSLLLLIEARHGRRLPDALRQAIRTAILHAAYSVRRRNVSMNYTNIAVQGTFVTLAAAEMLHDDDLRGYAVDRLHRFAKTVDVTGSFAEYNSPTYVNVTIANLTRLRMLVKDATSLALVDRIHRRAWLHLARHWHAPSRQLAGPMSRCYQTDIGQPLWIQKALNNRLAFVTLEEIRSRKARLAGEVGILKYQCPAALAALFLELRSPRQHREVFLPGDDKVRPVQGTTRLDRAFSLGSVNRGDFWIQRRPLLAYWKGGYLQLRVLKDDYDFASALWYGVQEKNCVLGLIDFRSPGGDKHPSLDPVEKGQFQASRLRARFDLAGVPAKAAILADGPRVAVDAGPVKIWIQFRSGGKVSVDREDGVLTVSLDWIREKQPVTVRWPDLKAPFAALTLAMEAGAGSLEGFNARCAQSEWSGSFDAGLARLAWRSPAGELALTGSTKVRTVAEQDQAFQETLNGEPVPLVRLSEERLAAG